MSESRFQPEFPESFGEHMSLEELVALIQQAPDELFETSAQKTQRAQTQLKDGHEKLSAFHANPSPELLKQAITHYRKAVELDPALAEAYIHLARALWEEGNISLENALHYCELAIQHEPGNPAHYMATAEFLQQADETEYLQRVYGLALKVGKPHQFFAIHAQRFGYSLQQLGQVSVYAKPMALASTLAIGLQSLIALPDHLLKNGLTQPLKATAAPTKGKTTATAVPGETQAAQDAWWATTVAKLIPLVPHAGWQTKALMALHQQAPSQRHLLEGLAALHKASGDTTKALSCYELLCQQHPNDASLHATLAGLYSKAQQPVQARRAYEQALAIQPNRFEWLFELGQLQTDGQEYLAALISFKEALKQKAHHPMVLSNMAYALFKLDDVDGSIRCYQEALSHGTDPQWKSAVAQTLGALLYQHEDDTEGALEALNTAVHVDPYNTDARIMLAELLFELGDFDAALNHYDFLATRDADNVDTHSHRGYILWQMDRNEEAIAAYEDALACDPNNAVVYNNLGVVYLDEMLNGIKAAELFAEALHHQPQYTLAAFNMGRAHELAGNPKDAAKAYGHALTLHECNPEMERSEIESRLHALFDV